MAFGLDMLYDTIWTWRRGEGFLESRIWLGGERLDGGHDV
jgi:hypothetical protein